MRGPIAYVDPFLGHGYYIYGKSWGWPLVYRSESMTGEFDWMEPWRLTVNISIETLFLFLAIVAWDRYHRWKGRKKGGGEKVSATVLRDANEK